MAQTNYIRAEQVCVDNCFAQVISQINLANCS